MAKSKMPKMLMSTMNGAVRNPSMMMTGGNVIKPPPKPAKKTKPKIRGK